MARRWIKLMLGFNSTLKKLLLGGTINSSTNGGHRGQLRLSDMKDKLSSRTKHRRADKILRPWFGKIYSAELKYRAMKKSKAEYSFFITRCTPVYLPRGHNKGRKFRKNLLNNKRQWHNENRREER